MTLPPATVPGRWLGAASRAFQQPVVAWSTSLLVVVLVSVQTIALRGRVTSPLGWSPYDGVLHVRQAQSLIDGEWLGAYDNLTLVKAPGYSLFISACHELGIDLKVGEQLVALLAALLGAVCVLVTSGRLAFAVPVFVLCAFNPVFYSYWAADFGRDALFASITVVLVAALFLTGHLLVVARPVGWVLLPAALGGAALAAYLLTREEGVTVLPVAAVALGAAPLVHGLRTGRRTRAGLLRRTLRVTARAIPALLVVVLATGAPVAAVLAENEDRYGVATASELAGSAFQGAYAQWQRVEAGPVLFRIPISERQREAVYPVSDAARSLEPFLEDPENPWRFSGCEAPPDCDYAGGWITWALRDAAADAGFFGSAGQAQDFFGRLAGEIRAACESGELRCRAALPATLAPLQRITVPEFVEAFTRLTGSLLSSKDQFLQPNLVPWATPEQRIEFAAVDSGVPPTVAGAEGQIEDYAEHEGRYQFLAAVYSVVLPVGVVLGLVLMIPLLLTRPGRRTAGPLTALAVALLFGALRRVALIAVIHAADYDADQPRYLYPAQSLLLAFVGVAVVEGLQRLDLGRLGTLTRDQCADDRPSAGGSATSAVRSDLPLPASPADYAPAAARPFDHVDPQDVTVPIRMSAARSREPQSPRHR